MGQVSYAYWEWFSLLPILSTVVTETGSKGNLFNEDRKIKTCDRTCVHSGSLFCSPPPSFLIPMIMVQLKMLIGMFDYCSHLPMWIMVILGKQPKSQKQDNPTLLIPTARSAYTFYFQTLYRWRTYWCSAMNYSCGWYTKNRNRTKNRAAPPFAPAG